MKKIVLTGSILCALSPMTSAQSSVSLYGIVDGGLSYSQMTGDYIRDKTNLGLAYGMQSGNRIGLRGLEDMGSGNKLAFQIENGFDLGNGTLEQGSRLFGRQAWFGVENNSWGYGRMGRQYNFATDYFGEIDPFAMGFGQASMGAAFGSTNMYSMSNTIKFQSSNMSGFQLGAGYSFAVGAIPFYYQPNAFGTTDYNYISSENNRQVTLGAKYASGPLYMAASFDKLYGTTDPINNSGMNPFVWNIGASYDFTVVKFSLAYGQSTGGYLRGQTDGMSGPNEGNNPYWGTGSNEMLNFDYRTKTSSYLVGLTIPLSASSRVFASWTFIDDNTDYGPTSATGASQSAYNLGYAHDFTSRTNMYAFFSQMNNVSRNTNTRSMVSGVGIRHMF